MSSLAMPCGSRTRLLVAAGTMALVSGCAGPGAGEAPAPNPAVRPTQTPTQTQTAGTQPQETVPAQAEGGDPEGDANAWAEGNELYIDDGKISSTKGDGAVEAEESGDESLVHGSLSARYVGRTTGSDSDQDLFGLLEATIGNETKDPVTGYVLARAAWDMDGSSSDTTFDGLEDTYHGPVTSHLYEAYVDFHEKGFSILRVGRMSLSDTPVWLHFEGVTIETAPAGEHRQQYGAYLGRQDYEYDSSSDGDSIVGGWFRSRLWEGSRLRVDAMHIKDEASFGDSNNDLYAVGLVQQVNREASLEGDYSWLEGKPRELDLRGTWAQPASGWLVNAWYHELLRTQEYLAEEFDPFFQTLQQYEPFRQARVMMSKAFESGYDLTVGSDQRKLKDSADEGQYNHDFSRYFVTGVVHDFLMRDLLLSLTGERWNGNGATDYASWGIDLTREWSKALRSSIGSYYTLYKDNFLLGSEQSDVRTYYVSMRYVVSPDLTWSVGVDHEDSDVDDFNTLTAKATWHF